jgi:hypothetical protein
MTAPSVSALQRITFGCSFLALTFLFTSADAGENPLAAQSGSKSATRLPTLSETIKWIENKVGEKAGGTFPYRPDVGPSPIEAGEEQHHKKRGISEACLSLRSNKNDLCFRLKPCFV